MGVAVVLFAVAVYISVGFLELSALAPFLEHVEQISHPNATRDDIASAVAAHTAACTLALGVGAVTVAGWAGRLSDRFGRRRMAAIPAACQCVAMTMVSFAAYNELGWRWIVLGWALQGLCGGPFVFLASAFAYVADHKRQEAASQRGRAFSALDGLLLLVASAGPLVGSVLVVRVGYWGVFATCAAAYAIASCTFLLAPPSPQPPAQPLTACGAWLGTSTPVLLWRMFRDPKMRALCVAFALALGGMNGGALTLVFYGLHYLGWRQQEVSTFTAAFTASGAILIAIVHPLLCRVLGRKVTDLSMIRGAYLGPILYFGLLGLLPRPDIVIFALLPLFALGPVGLPHFRACFSLSKADDAQGEQLAAVAALESLPALYAAPVASLAFAQFLHQPRVVLLGCTLLPLAAVVLLWVGVHEHRDAGVEPLTAPTATHAQQPMCINSDDSARREARYTEQLLPATAASRA